MAVTIDQSGLSRTGSQTTTSSRRNVLYLSGGGVVIVVGDPNAPTCPSGWGNGSGNDKIYVYYSNARDTTFTRVATISPSAAMKMPLIVNADLYSDDSIGVTWFADSGDIRYVKINRSGWTVGSEESLTGAHAGPPGYVDADISIGNGDAPTVALFYANDDGGTSHDNFAGIQIYTRRLSDNTWYKSIDQKLMDTFQIVNRTQDVSIQSLDGGTGTSRPFAVSAGWMRAGADFGVTIYTGILNESTGVAAGWTAQMNIDAGDLPKNVNWSSRARKTYIFRSGVNEFAFGLMTWYSDPRLIAGVFGWNGTAFTTVVSPSTYKPGFGRIYGESGLACTFGDDSFNFLTCAQTGGHSIGEEDPVNYVATIDRNKATIQWSGFFHWNNNQDAVTSTMLLGGTGRNYSQSVQDMVYYHEFNDNKFTLMHNYAINNIAPHAVTPRNGSTMTTSTPPVSLDADIDRAWPQSLMKSVWQIDTNSGFSSPLEFEQADTSFAKVEGTDQTGVYVKFNDAWPSSLELNQGVTWYIRGAMFDQFGNRSPWIVNSTGFIVSHPPAAANLQPTDGQAISYGSSGKTLLTWDFTDPYDKDFQTAFEVVIVRADTDSTIQDSTKVTSGDTSFLSDSISDTLKNLPLKWKVALWDKDDVQGDWSPWSGFVLVDPASIAITSPDGTSSVITPRPHVIFNGTSSPLADITFYRVSIEQNGGLVFDSDWVPFSASGDYEVDYRLPHSILHNDNNYTAVAQVKDEHHVESTSRVQFSTAWTPPADPANQAVNVDAYNTPDMGYVAVTWDDTARDDAFLCWVVYRTVNILTDPGGGIYPPVYDIGTEEEVFRSFVVQDDYEYDDYFAPTGAKIQYRVTQIITEYGDEVESESATLLTTYPVSDGYWLIDPDPPTPEESAFKLSITTSDEYTDEYEEASFDIIGRGRHYEQGSHWGLNGTLQLSLRNDGGTTARYKKRRLEDLKGRITQFYLRTPFGDLYYVYVGNMQVSRLAGTGQDEFCSVTLPYSQTYKNFD